MNQRKDMKCQANRREPDIISRRAQDGPRQWRATMFLA